MSTRVSDYALIIGHVWRCTSCRDSLFDRPKTLLIGYKLSETQRETLLKLESDSFHTVMQLSDLTGLTSDELYQAIDHPRARLRHLGSTKSERQSAGR